MSLQDILNQVGNADQVEIPAGWGQGRATFGGLIAALMQTHLENTLAGVRPLRSATIALISPASPGPLTLKSELIRQGKSVLQAECRAIQGEHTIAILLATFGDSRTSLLQVDATPAPIFKAPGEGVELPYIPGVVPEFTQKFQFSWTESGLPFTGQGSGTMGGWVRLRECSGPANAALLLAMVDAWPPAVLPMFNHPAPISTMTWTMEFVASDIEQGGEDWWQYLAETDYAAEGYAHIQSKLWSADGRLVALSRQTVATFY